MQLLAAAVILALGAEGSDESRPPPRRVEPVRAPAAFDPLPEMWGLAPLSRQTGLEDLDETVVLYLSERARFQEVDGGGRVWLAGGRQLPAGELTEARIADWVSGQSCLCALEYEPPVRAGELHAPAGAFHLASAPARTTTEAGIVTVEFRFRSDGLAGHATLRRLLCWSATDGTIAPLAAALPAFATLARKVHPGFADPPLDAREVRGDGLAASGDPDRVLSFVGGDILFQGGSGREPMPLDSPELLGVAKPGLFTLLREIGSGRRLAIDQRGDEVNRSMVLLNRQLGIGTRDPGG